MILKWYSTIFNLKQPYYSMSHTEGNSLGFEHGKIGDRIAAVINGKQIYKGLYKPKNPRTPKQQMHVYVWFQATCYHRSGCGKVTVRPGQASPSVYLGNFHV